MKVIPEEVICMMKLKVDYTELYPGLYKHSSSGSVTKWDMRIKFPNNGDYLSPEIMHTIEHTFNNYARNFYSDYRFLGVYANSSQTGFYILTRFIDKYAIVNLVKEYINMLVLTFSVHDISKYSCANFEFHDLAGAKRVMKLYLHEFLYQQSAATKYKKR